MTMNRAGPSYGGDYLDSLRKTSSLSGLGTFTFRWGDCWRTAFEYDVRDLASEICFYQNVLGMVPIALEATYALLQTIDKALCIGVREVTRELTDVSGFRICVMVADLDSAGEQLADSGALLCRGAILPDATVGSFDLLLPSGAILQFWGPTHPGTTFESRNAK